MEFKSNLDKPVSSIVGKVVIYDKKENPLMETKVNINKAFNFFKGTDIKQNTMFILFMMKKIQNIKL